MKALHASLLATGIILAPLATSLAIHADTLDTPRLNQERVPYSRSLYLPALQRMESSLKATRDDLSRIDIFMRVDPFRAWGDFYHLRLTDTETGEERNETLSNWGLWDDVGTFSFEPFEDSEGHVFRLIVETDEDNHGTLQLATDQEETSVLIAQPFYRFERPLWKSVWAGIAERLGLRSLLFLLVIPLLARVMRLVFWNSPSRD